MTDLLLKNHGADAFGLLSQEEDERWRTTLTVRSLDLEREQQCGPELLANDRSAQEWVVREAAKRGFAEGDLTFIVEQWNG
ncbi:MAG: hypothetical protein U1C74_07215 [Phenylobacterium sp.]|nr:hypothetical protein [Phenylobacterium sp.]